MSELLPCLDAEEIKAMAREIHSIPGMGWIHTDVHEQIITELVKQLHTRAQPIAPEHNIAPASKQRELSDHVARRDGYDWRCDHCVESAQECLNGDMGCPYRQPKPIAPAPGVGESGRTDTEKLEQRLADIRSAVDEVGQCISDDQGFIVDSNSAECTTCGKKAGTSSAIVHDIGCFTKAWQDLLAAMNESEAK